jgi:NAD(P)-dependent dehydrogenase (short-subunit alcohol dehydrogenase family)
MVVPVEYPEGFHRLSGDPGSAEQVARLMAFLLSDAADHISGSGMWIDGTESLVIGWRSARTMVFEASYPK